MSKVVKSKKEKKSEYFDRFIECVQKYSKILLVCADNVRSSQLAQVRKSLRGKAEIMMGKNTLIRKILSTILADHPEVQSLIPVVRGNIGFVFTNDSLGSIRDILVENKLPAPARAGAIAQSIVIVPAGPTGMPPEKTSFFQALGINTKINRGLIELVSDVPLLQVGDKVDASQAELLNKMDIRPFSYGLVVKHVYDSGHLYPVSVLDITEADLVAKFMSGITTVAALSLGMNFPTVASVPHSFMNGFKKVLAVAVATDITFAYAEKVKDMLANPDAYASAAPAAGAASGGAAAAPVEEEEEEKSESDIDMGAGLFGDDEEED
eukprot:Awhi_evm1s2221